MKYLKMFIVVLTLFVLPRAGAAQSLESVDACRNLMQAVAEAVEESKALSSLMTSETPNEEAYLSELYQGVKILTKSGEMFFRASDNYEAVCKNALREAQKIEAIRGIYDRYLEPIQLAHRFFSRVRAQAIRLGRQDDVDTFSAVIREYEDAVMKLVSVCQSDLAGTASADTCSQLSARIADALR